MLIKNNSIKMKILISILVSMLVLISCSPHKFALNKKSENRIEGFIMSNDYDKVEITADNELVLYEGSMVSMRTYNLTQLYADFTVTPLRGDGVSFYFRTVQNNFIKQPYIKFNFSSGGSSVEENGNLIATADSIKARIKESSRVRIMNDGILFNITVDCDTVYSGLTSLLATEFVVVAPMPDSRVLLSGIFFDDVIKLEDEIRETVIYESGRKGLRKK
jgi:hypothetical protein